MRWLFQLRSARCTAYYQIQIPQFASLAFASSVIEIFFQEKTKLEAYTL